MPFALRHSRDPRPVLSALPAFEAAPESRPETMASLHGRPVRDMRRRMERGHVAWVARLDGHVAGWGWIATREAEIGEIGRSFRLPDGDRYLWNFATAPAFRGLGVYPRLLDAMVVARSRYADRFWVACAPENHASAAGIRKAGFRFVARLSFDRSGAPALKPTIEPEAARLARLLDLPLSRDGLAACWRCARAGRGAMSCAPGRCRCDYQQPQLAC